MREFKINFEDTKIIRDFEGHSLKAYPDPATGGKPWTISYGLTGNWVHKGLEITEEESIKKFMEYINHFCEQLDSVIRVRLNKNQYIAVLSFTWNVGIGNLKASRLLKKINFRDFKGASEQFLLWTKANGKEMAGLVRRRKAEKELFDTSVRCDSIEPVVEAPVIKEIKEAESKTTSWIDVLINFITMLFGGFK